MWYGKFSDKYNRKTKGSEAKSKHKPAAFSEDRGHIQKTKFTTFVRRAFTRRKV